MARICEWHEQFSSGPEFALGHDIGERPDKNAGIVFKIIEARAVSVAPFSKFPEEAEVIFEPGSKFEVKGFYKLTDFILEDGGSALDWQEWKVSFDVIKQPQLKLEAAGKERDSWCFCSKCQLRWA